MNDQRPWGDLELTPEAPVSVRIGSLNLRLKRAGKEIWLLTEREDRPREEDGEWRRWVVSEDAVVSLRPAIPDRLLVVSHEFPFHLPGRGEARVYVRIPVFVQVRVRLKDAEELLVLDEPSHVLSDTWWGSIQEGELAYWLTTKARTQTSPDLFVPHVAMCPVQLENHSGESLPVDKFAVRARHLTMFHHEGRFWTDEVRVRYEGSAEGSEIDFGGRPPKEEPAGALIAEPRVPVRKGLQALTFDRLISLTAFGG